MDTQLFTLPARMDTIRYSTQSLYYTLESDRVCLCVWLHGMPHSGCCQTIGHLTIILSHFYCLLQCVVQLLGHKADFNKTSLNGGNPVYFACKSVPPPALTVLSTHQLVLSCHLQTRAGEVSGHLAGEGSNCGSRQGWSDPSPALRTGQTHTHAPKTPLPLSPSVHLLLSFNLSVSLSLQSGYFECVQLILQCHRKQVDHMIRLAMLELVPEPKMLGLLQDLCRSSPELLVAIISKMADATTTAGQELLRLANLPLNLLYLLFS